MEIKLMKSDLRFQKRCIYRLNIRHSNFFLEKGDFGICSADNTLITPYNINCCRMLLKRELKKKGRVHVRCNFNIPKTIKSTGVRMGKGKGDIDHYLGHLSKNDCFLEIKGVSKLLGLKLFRKISYKLPFRIKILDL
uniref:60S ribosomal protein L16 n=1 Tax=Pleurostomum flabellatum TaxID=405751 RepID=A0A7T0M431_9EUKA|nr:60S ribosomal protein L16 [Pleurostomum flabellatum]QPL15623.1 60S ribosomal protein L16 [Pleurostomum flabellatum]